MAANIKIPNFIFMLSDDLAMGDFCVYGQMLIQTPKLDRMAREGKPIAAPQFVRLIALR